MRRGGGSAGNMTMSDAVKRTFDVVVACKVMGELCGVLMYHENRFVNENLYLFDSTESIERMITKSMEIEQQITDPEMQMGQQM